MSYHRRILSPGGAACCFEIRYCKSETNSVKQQPLVKVRNIQNEFMNSSYLPNTNKNIRRISALASKLLAFNFSHVFLLIEGYKV